MSLEEVEISVTLSSDWYVNAPNFELYLDNELINSGKIFEKHRENKSATFTWKGKLEETKHTIKVKLLGKTNKDTIIDKVDNNKILHDQLLYINEISIDQIDLGFLVYKLGKFYPDKLLRPDLDDIIPNLTCIGYNGEWQLDFDVPTYLWLLEHF